MTEGSDTRPQRFWTFVQWGFVFSISLYSATYFDWGRFNILHEPAQKLAEAGFIAMILAVTVDLYLKTALARDAFEAAVGYVLPPYLQEEMAAIYSNALICLEHSQIVTLVPFDNVVRVTARMERTIKNISAANYQFDPTVIIDEWLVDGHPSVIRALGYNKKGEEDVNAKLDSITRNPDIPRLTITMPSAVIAPNGIIRVWYESDQIRHRNDIYMTRFRYATHNPTVQVHAPDDIGWIVEFGHRLQSAERYGKITKLTALLLPNQPIIVRWWNKADETRWRAAH